MSANGRTVRVRNDFVHDQLGAFRLTLGAGLCLVAVLAATGSPRPANELPTTSTRIETEQLFTGESLEATFLQLTVSHRALSQQQWRAELDNIKNLGFDTLVLQWSAYDNVSFFEDGETGPSTVARILAAAQEVGIDCYLGLSLHSSWWGAHTEQLLEDERSRNIAIARRLYSLAENFESFRGWYIPNEITELNSTDEQWEAVISFYSELSDALKKIDPMKSILASGYTDPRQANLVRFVLRWSEFLELTGIDVFILQDRAGSSGKDWRAILPFVEAVAILDEEFVGDVWLLAEIFEQTDGPPISEKPFQARPADSGRVREQLEALGPFRKKVIAFSYFDYMRPGSSDGADHLFQAYRHFLEERLRE